MKKILIFTFSLMGIILLSNSPVGATSGFNAGRIIDDTIFTNKSSMTVNDIQTFLNSKVPACDTNGQQLSEFGGPDLNGDGKVQRWEWGKQNYNQTTFPCLKEYTLDGVSAAQLIYNASQTYSINPQVIIVLLQKEQGLVTDTWPLNVQYRSATGYGCPDTAACDSQYYGLKNQINWAATMFRAILNNSPTWYTPYVLGNNYIQYNPNASCGGSTVDIQNRSTQALYNYTPYQPSQAALDAGWGTVNCGAYGNRNFYLYFTNWFGSVYGITEEKNGIYRLWNKNSNTHFMTADITEANTYLSAGWHYDRVVSHSSHAGVDVYRLYNKKTNSHFFTISSREVNAYTNAGWLNDGIVFKAPSEGKAVYRLYNKKTGGHIYTSSLTEVQGYSSAGWHYDGLAYYSNQPNDITSVYRMYSKSSKSHILISNQAELGAYTAAGWINDGIVFHSEHSGINAYRLYNKSTRSHFFTTSSSEVTNYTNAGWLNDGIVFKLPATGKATYRLYNKSTRSHFFTTSSSEVTNYTNAGWLNDGIVFYGSTSVYISRVYDQASLTHKLTKSSSLIAQENISNDGVIIKGARDGGIPIYELHNKSTGSYLYTSSASERDAYIGAGWTSNGSIFNTPQSGNPVYRMYSPNTQKHFITSSQTEVNDYTAAGWTNDGIVFYSNM